MDYFHIADKKSRPWSTHEPLKTGDVITTSEINPYFNYYLTSNYPKETVKFQEGQRQLSRLYVLQEIKENRMNNPDSQYVAKMGFETAKYFSNYARELILENVRKSEFNNLPSRQKCIWLAQGEENLQFWLSRIGKSLKDINVFKVVPSGILHSADEELLLSDIEPYDETLIKARQYWSGIITNQNSKEVLFEGSLKIGNLIS
ncbi:DUF2441 domain-containing protein [Enterobacter sp. BNK-34]|uniref:DUF2441 domain-containing protein n=1 Tax=Enterobacter sp. BNK-34 TaxID=3376171 RepID=UPI003B42E2A2